MIRLVLQDTDVLTDIVMGAVQKLTPLLNHRMKKRWWTPYPVGM